MSPLRMVFDEFRAKKVDTDHFRLLLAQTQDVDEVDLEGVTLLELASGLHASNVVPFARVLLHAGANRGIKNNRGGGFKILCRYCERLSACRWPLATTREETGDGTASG